MNYNESLSQMSLFGFGHQSHLSIPYFPSESQLIDFSQDFEIGYKTIYDPIHGNMTFPKIMWDIIDTPQFQRLRNLKQLSTSHFIYMGNNHTRFEHCLGTGFLSRDLVTRCFNIISKNEKIGEMDKKEINYLKQCVSIAGLCHDIGHGPFSHAFDIIIDNLGLEGQWDHEEFGGKIIKYLIDENRIEEIDNDMLKKINSLIEGSNLNNNTEYKWIYQIVANKENSIDVDKFDYIQRDIYHSGVKTLSVDYQRIFGDINIIDDNICFSEKTDMSLHSLFEARYCLHNKIYNHPDSICIESMVKDALLLSNDYFQFHEAIKSPEKFIKLDDNILDIMLTFSLDPDEEINSNKKLLEAEKIIKRIYNRELYTIIGEIPIPLGRNEKPSLEEFLSNENPNDEFHLGEKDVELRKKNINFGFKNKNPFETIYFYNPKIPNKCFKKSMEHLLVMPQVFSESTILVFCKDNKKNERARNLFEIYKNKLFKKWNISNENNINIINKAESPKEKNNIFMGNEFKFDENENKNLETSRFGGDDMLKIKRGRTKDKKVKEFKIK